MVRHHTAVADRKGKKLTTKKSGSGPIVLLPEFFIIVVILLNQIPSFFLISLGMAFLLTMKSITL